VGAVLVGWGHDVTWDVAYAAADQALYDAKAAGRNRVHVVEMIGVHEQP
jgi:PleD family two-component response regulator